jgi:DNA-binding CsgD family transcriptional regulator
VRRVAASSIGCSNRAMRRAILLYGLVLAVLAFALQWLEVRYFMHGIGTDLYAIALAVFFTILGIWVGARLSGHRPGGAFEPNERALRSLGISARQREVLALLGKGHSNKEIARLLGISPNTVKTHVASLLAKLEATRRTQAIRKARELEILS